MPYNAEQFPMAEYEDIMEELQGLNKETVVSMLRRGSCGFSRGASKYRGVTKHHQQGRWEARIGRVASSRYVVSDQSWVAWRGVPLLAAAVVARGLCLQRCAAPAHVY